ncbi:MAG: hypothetical protein IPL26_26840 [Leptospiraceae bacterium]|nr:hypothetical protein [Leptospiraceae bacterium]
MNGKGIKLFENGDKYDGNFQNGKFDGIGIYSTEIKDKNGKILSSKIYEGGWKNNKKAGKGKLTITKDGKKKIYSGKFSNGKLNGEGLLISNSEKYTGKFVNNRLNGYGRFEKQNGEKYIGDFIDHKFDGKGAYTFKDKSLYIGSFKKGKLHGAGRIFNSNHKLIKSGKWENGEFKN